MKSALIALVLLPVALIAQPKVGVNTTTPDANLHISGQSSIAFPNLRITEETDNFARIKMETLLDPGNYWDIAASTSLHNGYFNLFYKNDSTSGNVFAMQGDGILNRRGFGSDVYSYYHSLGQYRGFEGFFGDSYAIQATGSQGTVQFGTRGDYHFIIDTIGRVGIGTTFPDADLNIRSGSNEQPVAVHLANSSKASFLNLRSGISSDRESRMSWGYSGTLSLGRSAWDDSSFSPFLRLDGKTIEVLGTGRSIFIGQGAGTNDNNTINFNTGVGDSTLHLVNNGAGNTALGSQSLMALADDHWNTAVGSYALHDATGGYNTALGARAGGGSTVVGTGNVFIGYKAGYYETGSNKLYIDNNETTSPLLYGEFDQNLLKVNGTHEVAGLFHISATGPIFQVAGEEALWYDGDYFSWGYGADHNYFARDIRIGGPAATTPAGNLHISNASTSSVVLESSANDATIQLTDDASQGSNHQWTIRRDASAGGNLVWQHGGFHKMTITPSGNVGIGSTATSPGYGLFVSGTAGKPGGGSWANSSDMRLKQNVEDYREGLDAIQQIRPVKYKYNDLAGFDTNEEYVGVIAQELQAVAPDMVSEDERGYLVVDNSAMTYMLINAVQELTEQNEKLLDRIEKLESKENR